MAALGYLLALVLLLAWCGAVVHSLFGDRARGRRCPHCFYSLDGRKGIRRAGAMHIENPLAAAVAGVDPFYEHRCPECGAASSDPRDWYRTRRHWWSAAIASLILLPLTLGVGGFTYLQQTGGWGALPAWVTVRLMWIDDEALIADLRDRLAARELNPASAAHAVRVGFDWILAPDPARRDAGYGILAAARNGGFLAGLGREPLQQLVAALDTRARAERADAVEAVGLLASLQDADESAHLALWRAAGSLDGRISKEALLGMFDARLHIEDQSLGLRHAVGLVERASPEESASVVAAFGRAVAERAADREGLMRWLADLVSGDAAETDEAGFAPLALWLYCRLDGLGQRSGRVIGSAITRDDRELGLWALDLLPATGWSGQTSLALAAAIEDPDPAVAEKAVLLADHFGPPASALKRELVAYVRRTHRLPASPQIADAIERLEVDPRFVLAALVERLDTAAPSFVNGEEDAWMRRIGLTDDNLLPLLSPGSALEDAPAFLSGVSFPAALARTLSDRASDSELSACRSTLRLLAGHVDPEVAVAACAALERLGD